MTDGFHQCKYKMPLLAVLVGLHRDGEDSLDGRMLDARGCEVMIKNLSYQLNGSYNQYCIVVTFVRHIPMQCLHSNHMCLTFIVKKSVVFITGLFVCCHSGTIVCFLLI